MTAAGLLFFTLLMMSCSPKLAFPEEGSKKIRRVVAETNLLEDQFSGFVLYDPVKRSFLYSLNADKYFTPASNTKTFTLATALHYLPDTLPQIRFIERGDSLIFWGVGDPTFLHPDFEDYQHAIEFLRKTKKSLFYADVIFQDERYGSGWAWDDYAYSYQVEKSALPISGNRIFIRKEQDKLQYSPKYFEPYFTHENEREDGQKIFREECSNSFTIVSDKITADRNWTIPFVTGGYEVKSILENILEKDVGILYNYSIPNSEFRTINGAPSDTVYRKFMHQSDNFIAEQLLLMAAEIKLGTMNTELMISKVKEEIFNTAPDPLAWTDGSGLSRYNMFTPRTMTWLFSDLLDKYGLERLEYILAEGGKTGTISKWYGGSPSYVFAKTGTLRNKHCLSGFVKTTSGRTLVFSFMHNNYYGGSARLKEKMQTILEYIRDSF